VTYTAEGVCVVTDHLDDWIAQAGRPPVVAALPETWTWRQAIVWVVWRDDELIKLCEEGTLRYAERASDRIRAGLRPAGSEQELRTLLRAGRIKARGHREGETVDEIIKREDWPEWAGFPSGWVENDLTFNAGEMRRVLPYIPEAARPAELIQAPDWLAETYSRRGRRMSQLRRFRDYQHRRRGWLSFEEIVDWCARTPGTLRRDEALRAQAYADLRDAMLAGDFGPGARSRVLYFHPESDAVENRLRLAPGGLRTWLDFYGADNPVITTEILSRCWLPRDLCRNWFERQGIAWPAAFDLPGVRRVSTAHREPSVAGPDKISMRSAPTPEIHKAITAAYDNAETGSAKPPNLKEIIKPVQEILSVQGYKASGSQIQKLADAPKHKSRRRPVGKTVASEMRRNSK